MTPQFGDKNRELQGRGRLRNTPLFSPHRDGGTDIDPHQATNRAGLEGEGGKETKKTRGQREIERAQCIIRQKEISMEKIMSKTREGLVSAHH